MPRSTSRSACCRPTARASNSAANELRCRARLRIVAKLLRAAARRRSCRASAGLGAGDVRHKSGPLGSRDRGRRGGRAGDRRRAAAAASPGAVVVGEEAASADPSLLCALAGADLAFVVDPVDGTANFAAGAAAVRGDGRGGGAWRGGRRGDPRSGRRRHRAGAARGGGLDRGAGRPAEPICASRDRCLRQRCRAMCRGATCPSRCAEPVCTNLPRSRRQLGLSLRRA